MIDWYGNLRQADIDWFLSQGAQPLDLAKPWSVGRATVIFVEAGGVPYFEPLPDDPDDAREGELAYLFLIEDGHDVTDVAAWAPRTGDIGSYFGHAFAIGEDQIWNPASYSFGAALAIRRDPLSWLKAGRCGVVIIRTTLTYSHLAHVPRLSCESADHAREVEQMLRPPQPTAQLFMREPVDRRAA